MRMSRLFARTLRDDPADVVPRGLALLVRGGFVLPTGRRLLYLPLGARVRRRIVAALGLALESLGGQEIALPPPSLPAEGASADGVGLGASSHRRALAELARHVIASYRQLPCLLYGVIEEEAGRTGGESELGLASSTLIQAYSLHADEAERDAGCRHLAETLAQAIRRHGLECRAVPGSPLRLGGRGYEVVAKLASGARRLGCCEACDEWSVAELTAFAKAVVPPEPLAPLEIVHTPDASTIQAVAAYLGVGTKGTAKAVFLVAQPGSTDRYAAGREVLVFAVVRGDMSLSEAKLGATLGASRLRPATADEIRGIGAEPGFGSPIGIGRDGVLVVVDDLIPLSTNLVAGANRVDHHFRNVNYGRDYEADHVADIALAEEGVRCRRCATPLLFRPGVALGYAVCWPSEAGSPSWPRATAESGVAQPVAVASSGIALDALLVGLADVHHDARGLVWPRALAPYAVHLVTVGADGDPEVAERTERLCEALLAAGIDVLYDDRRERPGVKFNDADLIGVPWRLTVGARSLARGVVEARRRADGHTEELPLKEAPAAVRELLQEPIAEVP